MIFVATWAEALPLLDVHPRITGIGCRSYALNSCKAVLSAGFAGACRPELAPGDVLLTGDVSFKLRSALGAASGELRTLTHIASPGEKAQLAAEGAAAVDMETQHLAHAAAQRGIPFLGVRVIIDRAQDVALSVRTALHYPLATSRLRRAVIQALSLWPSVAQAEPLL